MNERTAAELLASAIPPGGDSSWADLGAGQGTFTQALANLLGRTSRVFAVDRDAGAIAAIERWATSATATVIPVLADFTAVFQLPGLPAPRLDGMLFANSLHYVRDADAVLRRLAEWLRPGGRLVVIEYDRRAANRWVPYPLPTARLQSLAESVGFTRPVVTATRPSDYGGDIYVAAADRL